MQIRTILIVFVAFLLTVEVVGQDRSSLVDSTYETKLDTLQFLSQPFDLGIRGRETLQFSFESPDTVVYTLSKENKGKVSLQIVSPKGLYVYDDLVPDSLEKRAFIADTSGSYLFRVRNKSLSKNNILLDLKTVKTTGRWVVKVNELGKKQPGRIDSIVTVVRDTINFLSNNFKLGRIGKEEIKFAFNEPDTVLYSFVKANDFNTILQITNPKGEFIYNHPIPDQGAYGSFIADTSASYTFRVRNKSFKPNQVKFVLKTVRTTKTVNILVKEAAPSPPPVIYDTIPEILLEEMVYLGAKKNIRSDYEKTLSFEFDKDVQQAYGTYVIAAGLNYPEEINTLVDLVTQQPIGDPLVALGRAKISSLPITARDNVSFEFKGNGIYKKGLIDQYDTFSFPRGTFKDQYKIALSNSDEVIGTYVYVKVVSFKRVPQTQ